MWDAIGSIGSSLITGIAGYFDTKRSAETAKYLSELEYKQAIRMEEYNEKKILIYSILTVVFLIILGYVIYKGKVQK